MERRRKSTAPQPGGGIEEDAATNVPTNNLPELPYIEETIENGGISIGVIPPLTECIAVAHEGRNTLAMLKRRKGESLAQLRVCGLVDFVRENVICLVYAFDVFMTPNKKDENQ